MPLTQIVLRLARNPEHPEGDANQGYVITAPIDEDGKLSLESWRRHKDQCVVSRFRPGDGGGHEEGWLTHRGSHWYIDYDRETDADDEPIFRLGEHSLALGNYITIHEAGGCDQTYRIVQHSRVRDPATRREAG